MSESEKKSPATEKPSAELVRWLQSLALPIWARGILLLAFLTIMLGGLSIAAWGIINQNKEITLNAISLLTIALPVTLVVIGLIFGQRSEERLSDLTNIVLDEIIPKQVKEIVCQPCNLTIKKKPRTGCRAVYNIFTTNPSKTNSLPILRFTVELNVRKVNIGFNIPKNIIDTTEKDTNKIIKIYQHAINGATSEGYSLNPEIAEYDEDDGGPSLIFFKTLPEEFLLRPIEKLYFAQDLSFLIRALIEAQNKLKK